MSVVSGDSVEVSLRFVSGRWRADGPGIAVEHPELRELDARILDQLARGDRAIRRAHVRFDTSCLPAWLRQYQAHYFNYVLIQPAETRS